MVETKAVSVRLPLDLLNELNSYATDKSMVRGGDANIGGAIIAVLRTHFGESDNVKQVSDNVDIDSMINEAIAAKLLEIKDEIKEEYGAGFRGISANITDLLQQRDREIDELKQTITPLLARLEAVETKLSTEATAPANFPSALLQKVKEVAPLKLKEAA